MVLRFVPAGLFHEAPAGAKRKQDREKTYFTVVSLSSGKVVTVMSLK
jgi:hypothetical protein